MEDCSIPELLTVYKVLWDFLGTVKTVTLIFISGRGSAISSAKEGKSGYIYNLVKGLQVVWAAFYENPNRIHTKLTFINPYSA